MKPAQPTVPNAAKPVQLDQAGQGYTDPVCGMQVAKSMDKVERFQGHSYYFCSQTCAEKFHQHPQNFVSEKKMLGQGKVKTAAATIEENAGCCGGCSSASGPLTDPVCGMKVNQESEHHYQHHDKDFYFCGKRCLEKFQSAPDRYLAPERAANSNPPDPSAIYTCPMHLEIEQVGPGTCPLCGMALEPKEASAERDDSELKDFSKRFKWSLVFSLPLALMSMLEMLPGQYAHYLHIWLPMPWNAWLQFFLASPVVLYSGLPFFERAYASFKTRHLNMFSLIGIGTSAAYLFSVFAMLFPETLPAAIKSQTMLPLYFEAAAVIISLVLLGQILELRARSKTNGAIEGLLALRPVLALRIDEHGEEHAIALDQVQLKDQLRVKPGAQIPVDGVLVQGQSYVDEAMITGEPNPVSKQINDHVIAGTLNQQGSFIMQAQRVGRETMLAKIIELVNQASRSRAPIQQLADTISAWFVPAVIVTAVTSFGTWMLLGSTANFAFAMSAAVSVLIIACPCALGLATPISVTVGIGRGATAGVLIKDARALERLAQVDTLVIDKTGTLTEGKPSVQKIVCCAAQSENELLSFALALEQGSEHPLAHAIIEEAQDRKILAKTISEFKTITGRGVQAQYQGEILRLGNPQFMRDSEIVLISLAPQILHLQAQGQTVMVLAKGAQVLGLIGVADAIKSGSHAAIERLQQSGLRIVILTGDNQASAQAIASALRIKEVHAELLPADKHQFILREQAQGKIVAMAGDGINDAPALAQADVGIAMGNGTDIAMQSAHVVLIKGDLRGIAKAVTLSRATMRNIRQNLFFAFAYNFVGIPIAAGLLYPWLGLLLNPMIASAAMSLSSVCVISNALRLRALKFEETA